MDKIRKRQEPIETHKKPMKRSFESAESECSKKRKFNTDLDKRSLKIVKPVSRRNPTFANDRLKKLREKICSDVVPLLKKSGSNVFTQKIITGNRQRSRCKSSEGANKLEDNEFISIPILTKHSTKTSDNLICHKNDTNTQISSRKVHSQDLTQLNDVQRPIKGDNTELSLLDNETEQSMVPNKRTRKIRHMSTSSHQKESSIVHNIHNKLDISINNDKEKKSEISIEMTKFPSSNISSTNHSSQTEESHNSSLNISITNSPLESTNSKISTSLSMFTTISNKIEPKKMCDEVINDTLLCSSHNRYVQDSFEDSSPSSREMANKNVTTDLSSKKSNLNLTTDNSPRISVEPSNSKYWTNYGEIIDSIYERFFSSSTEKIEMNSQNNNFFEVNTNIVNQQNFNNDQDAMEWDDDNVTDKSSKPSSCEKNNLQREMYMVVDTNIFLSDLHILEGVVGCGPSGRTKCILYVPWMVLTELDFMKDDRNTRPQLRRKVTDAVNFINKTLIGGGRKLIGQNIFEAEQQKHIGKAPDDKILSCCIQVKQNNLNVVLLSNDTNLKNKLLVNGVPAFSTKEMFMNPIVSSSNSHSTSEDQICEKFEKINEKMSILCSYIICECAASAYGKVWNKMGLFKDSPPWTFQVCLQIFKKYWFPVFRERLLKHCLRTVEQLDIRLNTLESSRNTDEFEEYIQECLSLCIFLKDLEEHKEFVESIVHDINSVLNFR